jgi:threonine dehydrogenase-like Zn-dependent dehydrogenase
MYRANRWVFRGIHVGSRQDFNDLNRYLEQKKIELGPLLDRAFPFEESAKAFEYLLSAKHSGKVVIKIDHSE